MAKKSYFNKTNSLQVVYDEAMNKYELVPNGTVELEEDVAKRFFGVLAQVQAKSVATKAADAK